MVSIKTEQEIEIMAEAGRRLARILQVLKGEVKVGVRGKELDAMAREMIIAGGDVPAFLGYAPGAGAKPFPATICFSVNDVVVHGIPGDEMIKDGDVVKLDIGLVHHGFYSDTALTVGVGNVSTEALRLIAATEESAQRGIAAAKVGNTVGDIGAAIEGYIEAQGFSVVTSLSGHGIGRELHEDPMVFNFGSTGKGEELRDGMVIAIEPMVGAGKGKTIQRKDDSFVMADGALSAHFEHTVAITKNGPRILTVM